MDVYEFSAKRKKKTIKPFKNAKPLVQSEPEMQTIKGKTPDSREEYYFALALMRLDYVFSYQVPIESIGL